MAITSHIGITLLEQSQAQKEMTINEALARIDAMLNCGVIDRNLNTPPGSPSHGDVYIVGASPTGAWSGKAAAIAYFDQIWRFVEPYEGVTLWVNDEDLHVVYNGSAWQVVSSGGGGGGGTSTDFVTVVEGRLTLMSNTPVTTSDVTAATTLYFTPYGGHRIALYNGSAWELISFSQVSLAVPATTNTLYDVWAYNNSGSVSLEITAWTNDTTRATALAWQNGVYVKSGAVTRRYLGSFRTTGTSGQTEDSRAKRFVWNYYNRRSRQLFVSDPAASWTYSTGSWRQANNNSANQVDFVRGVSEDLLSVSLTVAVLNSTATQRPTSIGIGLDATNTVHGRYAQDSVGNLSRTLQAYYDGMPSAGRHFLAWNEYGGTSDTQTWFSNGFFGMFGAVWG